MYKVIRIIKVYAITIPRNVKSDKKNHRSFFSREHFYDKHAPLTCGVRFEVFRVPDTSNYICLRSDPIKEKKEKK